MTDLSRIPLLAEALEHLERTAVASAQGSFTYAELLDASARAAATLLDGRTDLAESRVTFLVEPGFDHVATQWAIWRAGGIAVPLCVAHPRPELDYVVTDCGAETVVAGPGFEERVAPIAESRGLRFLTIDELRAASATALPTVEAARRAMIVYTSGTTSRPKGVVTTHANIAAQVESLVEAWQWSADDRILLVLPLHHVHGIVNVLCCALWSGATCEMPPGFDAEATWQRLGRSDLSLFMAVPTIYAKLVAAWEAEPAQRRSELSRACARLRLMVSGSAALPVSVLERWREISGH